jgi:hypothetical protein
VASYAIEQRFAVAALAGLGGGLVLMLVLFGMRPGVVQDMALPMFWGKLVFAGLLAAGGLAVLRRLARPGMGLGHSLALLALPPLVLWGLAAVALGQAGAGERLPLVLGSTWRSCAFNIAALSLPALVASLWALRGAAPTRLAWAGRRGRAAGGCPGRAGLCAALPGNGRALFGRVVPGGHGLAHAGGCLAGAARAALVAGCQLAGWASQAATASTRAAWISSPTFWPVTPLDAA